MNFFLFLLLNAVLLLRPEELFPEIRGIHLYQMTIIPCLLLSLPQIARELSPSTLRWRPVSVCVLLFFASTILSLFAQGLIGIALFEFGPEFGKVVLYYFLLIAVVDTPSRFRAFVATLIVLTGGLTAIALAQHSELVHFPNIIPCIQRGFDPETEERTELLRLVSSGIFNDPNDLCLMLGFGILSCFYYATTNHHGASDWLWLLPIPLFVYALLETHSKGGLLGVLMGGTAYAFSRFGGGKAMLFALAGGTLVLLAVGSRQGGSETARQRVMACAAGLTELFNRPSSILTGLGHGWFVDETGLVAHNSFVQAYVEFGVLGGSAFLGAFYFCGRLLYQSGRSINVPTCVLQARHFGFAVIVGYAAGCYSITRNFVVPTYLALGIASILLKQAAPTLPEHYQVTPKWFWFFVRSGVAGLLLMVIATQIMGRLGI